MLRLLDSQGICKALFYNETDFLDQPDITDTFGLIYNKIFPYKFVPDTQIEANTYITMQFRNYRPVNNSFKSGLIRINVLTHQELMQTDYGMLRCDYILSEIEKEMNQKRGIGLGKLDFHHMDEIYVNDKYVGMFVEYKTHEFN